MIEITQPDDFHLHLRDNEALELTVTFAATSFSRVIVMPNLKPPVRTVDEAVSYRNRILSAMEISSKSNSLVNSNKDMFTPLMTLYMTDKTTAQDILLAKESGLVYAVKLYPAGATTNSEYGVTSIQIIYPVLQVMSDIGMPLLIHGEVTTKEIDIFDREKEFIKTILQPLIANFPHLKIVMEHITTADAVDFIMSCSNNNNNNIAATITAHHLLYNRTDIFTGGICPHLYCLPILKKEYHRQALLQAATSGNSQFFIGTDSAPHSIQAKESACGCAGIFTSHAAIELYAEAFDSINALDKLEQFTSINGALFYGLPISNKKIKLVKEDWIVPLSYTFGTADLRPLRAGEAIRWKISHE
eukprot:gene11677-15637_t